MPDVVMPRLSDSMEEGTILRWLKADGDAVTRGDGLAEIETDKATLTYESELEGVLTIVALEGETLPVGAVIARLGEGAEAPAPGDVAESVAREPGEPTRAKGTLTAHELTRVQRTLARRTAEAKATVPEHALSCDVDMQACAELRDALERRQDGDGPVPTYEDLVVKACGLALRDVPRANAAYRDGRFELYSRINVNVVVPTEDAFVAPTIFDADRRPLRDIAADLRTLAGRARDGSITPPELSGGTFTVLSLADDDSAVTALQAIVTPPQAAVLAVGAVTERPVVHDRVLSARHTLTATLTCDHRILYGAEATRFLAGLRALLEQPGALAY